jgi:hypothetical protein
VKANVVLRMGITCKRIELPDSCPQCSCSFELNGVRVWEYREQQRLAEPNAEGLLVNDRERNPEDGEGLISYTSIWCPKCDSPLLATDITREFVS